MIDLATRMVVGWQLASHMRTRLVTDALAMAITGGHAPAGCDLSPDRGCQYTSSEFARFCVDNQIRASVGRTGVCWDNAAAESFFAALKNDLDQDPLHSALLDPASGRSRPAAARHS